MFRDAERQLQSAMKQQDMIDVYLLLAKCNTKLDQPISAVDTYKKGLEKFPNDTTLLTGIARIYEVNTFLCEQKPFSYVGLNCRFKKSDCNLELCSF